MSLMNRLVIVQGHASKELNNKVGRIVGQHYSEIPYAGWSPPNYYIVNFGTMLENGYNTKVVSDEYLFFVHVGK